MVTRNYSGTLASHRCCRDQSHSWIRDEESATLNIFVGNMTPIKLYQSFTSFYTMLIQYYNVIENNNYLRNALQVLYCVVDIIWLCLWSDCLTTCIHVKNESTLHSFNDVTEWYVFNNTNNTNRATNIKIQILADNRNNLASERLTVQYYSDGVHLICSECEIGFHCFLNN